MVRIYILNSKDIQVMCTCIIYLPFSTLAHFSKSNIYLNLKLTGIAVISLVTSWTLTSVPIHPIKADASILTRLTGTLINFYVTQLALKIRLW